MAFDRPTKLMSKILSQPGLQLSIYGILCYEIDINSKRFIPLIPYLIMEKQTYKHYCYRSKNFCRILKTQTNLFLILSFKFAICSHSLAKAAFILVPDKGTDFFFRVTKIVPS